MCRNVDATVRILLSKLLNDFREVVSLMRLEDDGVGIPTVTQCDNNANLALFIEEVPTGLSDHFGVRQTKATERTSHE